MTPRRFAGSCTCRGRPAAFAPMSTTSSARHRHAGPRPRRAGVGLDAARQQAEREFGDLEETRRYCAALDIQREAELLFL